MEGVVSIKQAKTNFRLFVKKLDEELVSILLFFFEISLSLLLW